MSRKTFESSILVAIAVVTFGIMLISLRYEGKLNNQKTLFYQIQAIRTAINLYKAINRTNPPTLIALVTETYTFPDEERHRTYLEGASLGDSGSFSDPFGNPYTYDADSGWVHSSTKGYEFW